MKKHILSLTLALAMLATATISHAAVNNATGPQEKIMKDFTAQFASAPVITLTGNGYIANAVVDGRQVSSAYNKNGNRVYSIVRYTSDNLDKNIIDIVKGSYNKYFITSMEKVAEPGLDPVYLVHLTNNNSIKTVRVSDGNTELLQDFKKI
jgi:hypothetical protein